MENNKERDEAYRKSLNEVANLQAILKDLLGMDVNFIPKFKKDESHLQAERDKDRERLETQMFLTGLKAKDSLNKSREDVKAAQQRQDILSKGLAHINKAVDKKDEVSKEPRKPLYRIIFRVREMMPITITKAMYDSLIADIGLISNLSDRTVPYEGLIHGTDGDDRVSVRQSDILAIVKV